MANILPFFILAELDAAQFRQATAGQENRIEPRKIDAGPHKGKWAIPSRVQDDPAFAALKPAFAVMTEIAVDADEAWPQVEE